jgi:hypothetical protein
LLPSPMRSASFSFKETQVKKLSRRQAIEAVESLQTGSITLTFMLAQDTTRNSELLRQIIHDQAVTLGVCLSYLTPDEPSLRANVSTVAGIIFDTANGVGEYVAQRESEELIKKVMSNATK